MVTNMVTNVAQSLLPYLRGGPAKFCNVRACGRAQVVHDSGAPEADLKWGGHGLLEVSWAPKGPQSGGVQGSSPGKN